MLDFGFYHGDCMDYLPQFPDKYFDLAIVDPPYGDGGGHWLRQDGSRFGGRFDKYKPNMGGRESVEQEAHGHQSTAKKLLRGILPQISGISTSCSVSHAIRLYGAVITFCYHQHDALSYGAN